MVCSNCGIESTYFPHFSINPLGAPANFGVLCDVCTCRMVNGVIAQWLMIKYTDAHRMQMQKTQVYTSQSKWSNHVSFFGTMFHSEPSWFINDEPRPARKFETRTVNNMLYICAFSVPFEYIKDSDDPWIRDLKDNLKKIRVHCEPAFDVKAYRIFVPNELPDYLDDLEKGNTIEITEAKPTDGAVIAFALNVFKAGGWVHPCKTDTARGYCIKLTFYLPPEQLTA
jgi:hypothetical protein